MNIVNWQTAVLQRLTNSFLLYAKNNSWLKLSQATSCCLMTTCGTSNWALWRVRCGGVCDNNCTFTAKARVYYENGMSSLTIGFAEAHIYKGHMSCSWAKQTRLPGVHGAGCHPFPSRSMSQTHIFPLFFCILYGFIQWSMSVWVLIIRYDKMVSHHVHN